MKKVLKVMLKVLLWLLPCAGTIVCFVYALCTKLSIIGNFIHFSGQGYLNDDCRDERRMSYAEYRALGDKERREVLNEAIKRADFLTSTGWKWICGK